MMTRQPTSDYDDQRRRGMSADRGRARSDHNVAAWDYPWPPPPIPLLEHERLEALRSLDILDTRPEEAFDTLCAAAATAFECPIAGIGFMDADRHWFKASVGLRQREFPRRVTFCAHALTAPRRYDDALVVLDTATDRRFAYNPLVTGPAAIRFYAGAPIWSSDGHVLGTVFVMDAAPRAYCDPTTLQGIAASVAQVLVAHSPPPTTTTTSSMFPPSRSHPPLKQPTQPQRPEVVTRPRDAAPGVPRAVASPKANVEPAYNHHEPPGTWQHPWPPPPRPSDEPARLRALRECHALHTHDPQTDAVLDGVCIAAAETYHCPMAAIGFLGMHEQWLKATVGLLQDEIPRSVAFCAHLVAGARSPVSMVVLDTVNDPRFALNPLVTGRAGIRFYASAPVWSDDGHVLGSVFVMDTISRQYCDDRALRSMASKVTAHLARRHHRQDRLSPRPQAPTTKLISVPNEYLVRGDTKDKDEATVVLDDVDGDVVRESEMESMLVNLLRRTMQTQHQVSSHVGTTSA
ncbi:hypothetical protein DYB37_010064 [Aphanomyces astaci]|uniref:GAF domain-containing protein n=2 Tax=Aphanomyces astaci TaxID=112090 RepID=A0A3R6X566_APHAT|nr:hypothetical protein DYB35_009132 [Aphanomyces astaci]RHZ12922.1 hypothetical protein DYB37_010064 [Aphanomyces astaci]